MATYNGHKSWAQWNVALWLLNDENEYKTMKHYAAIMGKDEAARALYHDKYIGHKTPDGAKFTITAIRNAMKGI